MLRSVVGLLALFLLVACSPAPPPVHPLGADCTWPERVDLDRYAVVLASKASLHPADRVVLIDTLGGGVAASCSGLTGGEISSRLEPFTEDQTQRIQLPPLNRELTSGLGPGGVVDLRTGEVTPDAAPEWPMVALLDGTQVLRSADVPDSDRTHLPDEYCIAPSADVPLSRCRPLEGVGEGDPAIHPDRTVGWAPRVPVPVTLTTTDGSRTLPIQIQTDGTTVVQTRFGEHEFSSGGASPVREDQGRVPPLELRLRAAPPVGSDRIGWYELEPSPTLYLSDLTLAESERAPYPTPDHRILRALYVLDDGSAVLSYEEYAQNAFYRVTLDGTMTELARIPTVDDTRFATIAHWPESATTTGRA